MTVGATLIISSVFFLLSGFFIFFTIVFNRRILSHKSQVSSMKHEQTRNLLKTTIETQEIERKRIGANIHDDVGPILSAIKLEVNQLLYMNQSEIHGQIGQIKQNLDDAVQLIRNVSRDLVPSVLYELGLSEALRNLADRIARHTGMEVKCLIDGNIDQYSKQKELALYRVLQEGFTNILRHADASLITVEITKATDSLEIKLFDNGSGFDVKKTSHGLGLKNMEARVESLDGKMLIRSDPHTGTMLCVNIPQ